MMKNVRKALLGLVVIGGLMFVGCQSSDVLEDPSVSGVLDDDQEINESIKEDLDNNEALQKAIEREKNNKPVAHNTEDTLKKYMSDDNSSYTQPNNNSEGSNDNQSGDIYIQNHQPMKNGKPVKISRVVEPPVNSDWGDIPDNYLYLRCISCDEPFLTNDLSKERCSDCENAIEIDLSNLLYCDECGQKQVDPDSGYCFNCGKEYFD